MDWRLRMWILSGLCFSLIYGSVYGVGQQILRQSAYDPQIQLSEDIASALASGQASPQLDTVDITRSLAPFIIIYTKDGQMTSSTARLEGTNPAIPLGVLSFAQEHGQNRLTWQPKPGVRIATVVTYYTGGKSGFVLSGRSLRVTEERIMLLGRLALAAEAASIIISFFGCMILLPKSIKK